MPERSADRTQAVDKTLLDSGRFRKTHASLVVLRGAELGRDFRLRRSRTVLGRGTGAEIRILDDLVSREHALVEHRWDKHGAGFVLTDLSSTNGTLVNNRPVARIGLREGDKIQIGDTLLKFVLLDDIEARYHEEVRRRITFDGLTGLLTRESLFLALEMELRRCRRYGLPLAVLMMDLDRFKSVNDTYGHPVGSRVLEEVGGIIRRSLRNDDVSGRYGGEEFIAYLSEKTGVEARHAAERIRRSLEEAPVTRDGTVIRVTLSIGVALHPVHGTTVEALVERADRALYRAKAGGRNRVCVEP